MMMMMFHQIDPGWFDRHWYGDHQSRAGRFPRGRTFRLLISRVRAVNASLQVSDFNLWHSPLA